MVLSPVVSTRRPSTGALRRYGRALRTARGITGLSIFLLLVVIALAAPLIGPQGYDVQGPQALSGFSAAHPFGTDELGRDIFIRTVYGLRTDLSLILSAVPVSLVLGTLIGLAGAFSSILGSVFQRVLDIILGFPGMILGILLVLILGHGWWALFVTIVIAGLPTFGRLARAGLLSEQERDYVKAAELLKVSRWRIMTRHVLPNTIDPLLAQTAVFMVYAVFIEAGLSIVGLGITPPSPSLGAMLNTGARYAISDPSYVLGPSVFLLVLTLSFMLISDALNEAGSKR